MIWYAIIECRLFTKVSSDHDKMHPNDYDLFKFKFCRECEDECDLNMYRLN